MSDMTPTIKGIFVNSHIQQLREQRGEKTVELLKDRFGKPIDFNSFDDVPIRDEVKILELCIDILQPDLPEEQRSLEAGRLHFKNFTTTPFAKIIFSQFKNKFKTLMLHADNIAGHVFKGIEFESKELGDKSISVTMKNNDYPIEHFAGLFEEWMRYSGLKGRIKSKEVEPNCYEYVMEWK